MDRIFVYPGGIRCLGNIMTNHDVSEFIGGDLSTSSEVVQGRNVTVFTVADNSFSPGVFNINSNGHLTFTLEGDSDITFSINSNGHLIASGTQEMLYSINSLGHCIYGG